MFVVANRDMTGERTSEQEAGKAHEMIHHRKRGRLLGVAVPVGYASRSSCWYYREQSTDGIIWANGAKEEIPITS